MKCDTTYSRLVSRIGLTTFSALAVMLMSLVLFAVGIGIAWAYRNYSNAPPTDALPLWLILFIGALMLAFAAAYAGLMARALVQSIVACSEYLLQTRHDPDASLTVMPFAEMRSLRVRLLRTVGKMRREMSDLQAIAFTDTRTRLPNITALEYELNKWLTGPDRETMGALICLDLDGFGRWYELLGAAESTAILRDITTRLTDEIARLSERGETAAENSLLGALHNNRLALFLPEAGSREAAARVVRALRIVFTKPVEVGGRVIKLGLSGGIAMCPEDGETPHALLRNGDLALKTVRSEMRTGFKFYAPRLNRLERGKYRLESELREAVKNREFRAVFQPKIDFSTGKIIGAEALARWRREGGKVISPAAFIPLAEEIGLIEEIGQQILEQACVSARTWIRDGHDVSVAVNVSPLQFERGNFAESILATLKRTGLPPHRLELEITETMAVSDPQRVVDVMRPLKRMGMALAIDDFGTGHSNLSMLTRLPFDVFKIDRSFVSGLDTDSQAPAIVEMILAMAETLGLKTVAEGVETPQQADFLRRRGCTIAQGFLYSPGLPHAKFIELLRNWDAHRSLGGMRKVG